MLFDTPRYRAFGIVLWLLLLAFPATAYEPFGTATISRDFEVNGVGLNVDTIAFWEAPDPANTLMFVSAKGNSLVEVWRYPFVGSEDLPLTHATFGTSQVNGVIVDQDEDLLYVAVSDPANTVSVFSLPDLEFVRNFSKVGADYRSEPNLTLLERPTGEKHVYVSADDIVFVHDAPTGDYLRQFTPVHQLETMAADDFHQLLYIPDENNGTGVHVYDPDGQPILRSGTDRFGSAGVFQGDGEGILIYECPEHGADSGCGLVVVVDQLPEATELEFFDRKSWNHLGTLFLDATNTDGIASTQSILPDHPAGLLVAIDDDRATFGFEWDRVLEATGLVCTDDGGEIHSVRPAVSLESTGDQDDMCIWIHPTDPSLSVVASADKDLNAILVFDLEGFLLQSVPLPGEPGNIDVRYRFPLAGELVDIIAFNDRTNRKMYVYQIDPATRALTRIDNDAIVLKSNYGFCLYRSLVSSDTHAFTVAKSGWIHQYTLIDEAGLVGAIHDRKWNLGSITEGCVADDQEGVIYFAQEDVGIWKFGAEPDDDTTGQLIARIGENGLTDDVEGLTLYYRRSGKGYLIASSQGSDSFIVYERAAPHRFVQQFEVDGVRNTDGIDVTNVGLGPSFPYGIFTCHSSRSGNVTVKISAYENLGLAIERDYWNPRDPSGSSGPVNEGSEPLDSGYRTFSYGEAAMPSPTAEKPQSKLWYNDGSWWGILWHAPALQHQIARFDSENQSWTLVGPSVDERANTLSDVLWDGEHLYVLSHVRTSGYGPALLYRYRYDRGFETYHLDPGFPVEAHDRRVEATVLAKDSAGKLWVTYEASGKIWVNRSLNDDRAWGEPMGLPFPTAAVLADDLSSIVAFGGQVGVMWSNQVDGNVYFSVHRDGAPDDSWSRPEIASNGSDDHISLRASDGKVYAVVKTDAVESTAPLVLLLRRDRDGSWDQFPVATKRDGYTRPMLMLDEDARRVYVFARSHVETRGTIRMKSTSMDRPDFEEGVGGAFLQSGEVDNINDATSTKQNVNHETGLLILASDRSLRTYVHNYMELEQADPTYTLHVDRIEMNRNFKAKEDEYELEPIVHVVDWLGRPVHHADVYGVWTGGISASDDDDTDSEGRAKLKKMKMRGDDPAATFCVDRIRHRDLEYYPAANNETCWTLDPATDPARFYHVDRVEMIDKYKADRKEHEFEPLVFVVDGWGHPVKDVKIKAVWSGAISRTDDDDTDSDGEAKFDKRKMKGNDAVMFCVERLEHPGINYDPASNGDLCWVFDAQVAATMTSSRSSDQDDSTDRSGPGERDGAADPNVEAGPLPVAAILSTGLAQNQPNPFRSTTDIAFQIARVGHVRVVVYNAAGQMVRELMDRDLPAGSHQIRWDGRDSSGRRVSAGVYLYRLETRSLHKTKKMNLLR